MSEQQDPVPTDPTAPAKTAKILPPPPSTLNPNNPVKDDIGLTPLDESSDLSKEELEKALGVTIQDEGKALDIESEVMAEKAAETEPAPDKRAVSAPTPNDAPLIRLTLHGGDKPPSMPGIDIVLTDEAKKVAADKAEAERLAKIAATEKASEKLAADKKVADEKLALEQKEAADKAEAQRLAKEKSDKAEAYKQAEAKRIATEKLEAEEKESAERLAKAKANHAEADRLQAEAKKFAETAAENLAKADAANLATVAPDKENAEKAEEARKAEAARLGTKRTLVVPPDVRPLDPATLIAAMSQVSQPNTQDAARPWHRGLLTDRRTWKTVVSVVLLSLLAYLLYPYTSKFARNRGGDGITAKNIATHHSEDKVTEVVSEDPSPVLQPVLKKGLAQQTVGNVASNAVSGSNNTFIVVANGNYILYGTSGTNSASSLASVSSASPPQPSEPAIHESVWPEGFIPDTREDILKNASPAQPGTEFTVYKTIPAHAKISFNYPSGGWNAYPSIMTETSQFRYAYNLASRESPSWADAAKLPWHVRRNVSEVSEMGFENRSDSPISLRFILRPRDTP